MSACAESSTPECCRAPSPHRRNRRFNPLCKLELRSVPRLRPFPLSLRLRDSRRRPAHSTHHENHGRAAPAIRPSLSASRQAPITRAGGPPGQWDTTTSNRGCDWDRVDRQSRFRPQTRHEHRQQGAGSQFSVRRSHSRLTRPDRPSQRNQPIRHGISQPKRPTDTRAPFSHHCPGASASPPMPVSTLTATEWDQNAQVPWSM